METTLNTIPTDCKLVETNVTSCTSESEVHKANNTLLDDTYRYWQTADDVDLAVLEIQFPQPIVIKAIDIGNAGSALIEVLVGHSSWEETEYQVLVPLTVFMTASDSKDKMNRNRVKRFEGSKLSSQTSHRKWEKIRVICKQPFTKDKIGLTMIKVYTLDKQLKHSNSKLNESVTDVEMKDNDDSITVPTPLKSDATQVDIEQKHLITPIKSKSNLSRSSSILNNIVPGESIIVLTPKKTNSKIISSTPKSSQSTTKEPLLKEPDVVMEDEKTDSEDDYQQLPPIGADLSKPAKLETPFNQILKGVVLVIGGIVNPEKGYLRERAVEMGADYKADWCREATHLCTPFSGTPKFDQAKKSGGSIVSPDWINDCYKEKSRLPIKTYQVTKNYNSSKAKSSQEQAQSNKVISLTKKKKKGGKKKKPSNPDDPSDTEDEDDGLPNAYDLNDDFIDTGDIEESGDEESEDSNDEGETKEEAPEDMGQLFNDGLEYLNRVYGSNNVNHLLGKNKKYMSPGHKNNNNNNSNSHKSSYSHSPSKPKPPTPKKKSNPPTPNLFNEELLFNDANNTQALSPEEIKTELSRMVSKGKLVDVTNSIPDTPMTASPNVQRTNNNTDDLTDEDEDLKPESFAGEQKQPSKLQRQPTVIKGKEYIIHPLPTFFDGIEFYLSIKDESIKWTVTRYITAYNGFISQVPTTSTKYFITDKNWDKLFDAAKLKFPSVTFLKPTWVFNSHSAQKALPIDGFQVEKVK